MPLMPRPIRAPDPQVVSQLFEQVGRLQTSMGYASSEELRQVARLACDASADHARTNTQRLIYRALAKALRGIADGTTRVRLIHEE